MPYLDIVSDILQRVLDRALPSTVDAISEIESDVRKEWGGARHYVAKIGESGRAKIAKRDRMICAARARGVPEEYLSLRYRLSVRRIRQIVVAMRSDG